MSASHKRVIRTIYQILVALVVAVPVILGLLPPDMAASTAVIMFAAWTAFVAKVMNTLEDAGYLPAWLKDDHAPVVDEHRIAEDF